MWHSGEDKNMETTEILIKRKVVAGKGLEWGREKQSEHRGFVEQWKSSVCYYNDVYTSWYIYSTHRMYNTKS